MRLLSRLFEHSVEDGMKLAEQLKMTPEEYEECINNANFAIKHPEIRKQIIQEINQREDKIQDSARALDIKTLHGICTDDSVPFDELDNWSKTKKPHLTSPIASKLLNEMDDIYSQYLRIREFKTEHPKDPRTAGERLAEGIFENVKDSGKYFTTKVIDTIYDIVVKDFYPAKDKYYSSKQKQVFKFFKNSGLKKQLAKIQNSDLIEPQIVHDLINIIKTNVHNMKYDEVQATEKIEKILKDAIYRPL